MLLHCTLFKPSQGKSNRAIIHRMPEHRAGLPAPSCADMGALWASLPQATAQDLTTAPWHASPPCHAAPCGPMPAESILQQHAHRLLCSAQLQPPKSTGAITGGSVVSRCRRLGQCKGTECASGIKRLKNRKKLGSNIPTSEAESLCPTTQQQLSLVAACVGSGWTPTCSETTGRQEIKSAAIKFSLLVCLKSCCTILEKKGNLSWFINAL